MDSIIIEQAKNLIAKYGIQGLRTLDSIQLSTSALLRDQSDLFKTADKLLDSFLNKNYCPLERIGAPFLKTLYKSNFNASCV